MGDAEDEGHEEGKEDNSTAGQNSRKAPAMTRLQEGGFVAIKIHKICRTDGDKKGKLVPKVEGPYLIQEFTDDSHMVAIVADAN